MKSIEGNFDNKEVDELLNKHFIELRSVSPEGSTHVLDIKGLKDPTIKFWCLWESNHLIGCGALKFLDKNHGEFKSIRIADKFRKKGNGIKIIKHLIEEAKKLPEPPISRTEYDLKDELIRESIMNTEDKVNENGDKLDKIEERLYDLNNNTKKKR